MLNFKNTTVRVRFSDTFVRQYKKLTTDIQDDIDEKVELFKDRNNHQRLKVHKLGGRLKDFHSFSVNYSYRIIFYWENGNATILSEVGNHDIYDK